MVVERDDKRRHKQQKRKSRAQRERERDEIASTGRSVKEGRLYRSVYELKKSAAFEVVFPSKTFSCWQLFWLFGPKFFGVLGGDDLPFPPKGRGSPFFLESGVRLRFKDFFRYLSVLGHDG